MIFNLPYIYLIEPIGTLERQYLGRAFNLTLNARTQIADHFGWLTFAVITIKHKESKANKMT